MSTHSAICIQIKCKQLFHQLYVEHCFCLHNLARPQRCCHYLEVQSISHRAQVRAHYDNNTHSFDVVRQQKRRFLVLLSVDGELVLSSCKTIKSFHLKSYFVIPCGEIIYINLSLIRLSLIKDS